MNSSTEEDAVRTTETALVAAAFEHSGESVCFVDQAGRFVLVNPAMSRLVGYSREELCGMTVRDLVAPGTELRPFSWARGGEPGVRVLSLCRKDGSQFDGEISAYPMTVDGQAVILGVIRDAARHRHLADELRGSEAQFQSVFEQAGVGIGLVALDGTFLRVNPAICNICDRSGEELVGRPLADVVHPDDRERVGRSFELLASGELEQLTMEHRMVCGGGGVRDVRVSGARILDAHGRILRLVGVVEDITDHNRALAERSRLEAKIGHAQKLESLGVLAGGIAHDFNNLLVGMLGNASLALLDLPRESPARGYLCDIEKTATRAGELARQMLAYSGRGRFLVERLDLGALVQEMVHLLEASISKKATLRFDLAPGLPPVDMDTTQIRQVVMNLITNASDALGEDTGVISLTTGAMECDRAYLSATYLDEDLPEGLYVYLEVADDGCGMLPEVAARIFDPFFTTKFQGRGLGLAAVLGIVRGHQGAVRVTSEEGGGTSIVVLLPAPTGVVEADVVDDTTDVDLDSLSASGRILVVDDEPGVRTVARHMLERLGYEVVEAVDGTDAVRRFREDPGGFRGVLLDLTMPRMDGEECFQELRRIRPDVRVLLSSGYNQQELIVRFTGEGLAGFIQKPYRIASLGKAVTAALAGAHPAGEPE